MNRTTGTIVMFMTLLLSLTASAQAEDTLHFGVRPGVTLADGEPANDILSVGVFGRYRLTNQWLIGIAVDNAEFDFEDPARVLGLNASEVVDANRYQVCYSVFLFL